MNLFARKNIFICMGMALLLSLSSISIRAEDNIAVNDIKFPLESWSDGLLSIVELGSPNILDKEDDFDVEPYPLNDSITTKNEIAYLLEIAKTERTEDNIKRIIYENHGVFAHEIFINEGLVAANNTKLINLFEIIAIDHEHFILERKKHFSRPRPSQLSSELKLVLPNPQHPSYPSGHASQAYMIALVLSDFDPAHADVYKQFAIDIAHRREIAGFHYPSDSVAGRKLAVDIFARLRENEDFEKRYKQAKLSFIVSSKLPDDKEIEQK